MTRTLPRVWRGFGAVLVAALFSCNAYAHHDPICPEGEELQGWHIGGPYANDAGSAAAACGEFEAQYKAHDSTPENNNCSLSGTFDHNNYQTCLCIEGFTQQYNEAITPVCGEGDDPCEATAGLEIEGQFPSGGDASSVCGLNDSNIACMWNFSGIGLRLGHDDPNLSWFGTWTQTGSSCEDGEGADHGEDMAGFTCIVVGSDDVCIATNGTNCGTFNDQPVCVESVPPGNCIFLGDGGMACDDSAGTPPTPDVGTPGIEAEPDGTLRAGNGQGDEDDGDTVNYYNGGTVAGSTTQGDPPGDYDPPEDGDDCTPGTDCPGEWVDRAYEPGVPGSYEAFQVPTREHLSTLMPEVSYTGEEEDWRTFFRQTFPFSLIAGPITSIGESADAPSFEWDYGPQTAEFDLSVVDSLAATVKVGLSLLMVWGFWWFVVETLWRAF